MRVDRVVRWDRPAQRHRIGMDDRGIELEVVALDRADAIVVIYVMPTSVREATP